MSRWWEGGERLGRERRAHDEERDIDAKVEWGGEGVGVNGGWVGSKGQLVGERKGEGGFTEVEIVRNMNMAICGMGGVKGWKEGELKGKLPNRGGGESRSGKGGGGRQRRDGFVNTPEKTSNLRVRGEGS